MSGPGRSADSVALQLRLAESAAEVDAARALHRQDIREILDRAARGEGFSELDRIRYRRDKAFMARLCVRAVDRLFEGSGARAVLDAEPIQRCHRDAHGASHHAALSWDLVAEQFGRQAMGSDPSRQRQRSQRERTRHARSQGSREGGAPLPRRQER